MPQWFSENKSCVRKLLTFLAAATAMPGVCVTRYPSFSLAKIRVNISPLSQSLKITQNVSFWFSQFWFLFIAPDSNGQICTVLCNVVKCHFLCDFQIQWVLLLLPFQQKIWKCNRAAPIFSQYIPKPRFHTKSSKGWGHTAEASLTRCFKIPTSFHFEISFYNILGAKIQVVLDKKQKNFGIFTRFARWFFPFCGQGFCRENSKLSLIQTIVVCAFAPVTLVGQH